MMTFNLFKTLCFSSLIFTSIMGAADAPIFHPEVSEEDREKAKKLARQVVNFWFTEEGGQFFNFLSNQYDTSQNNLKKLLDKVSDSDNAKKYLKIVWDKFPFDILLINKALEKHKQDFVNKTLAKLECNKRLASRILGDFFISNWVASLKSAEKKVDKTIATLKECNLSQWKYSLSACPLDLAARKIRNSLIQMYIWVVYAFLPECLGDKIAHSLDNEIVESLRATATNMKLIQIPAK